MQIVARPLKVCLIREVGRVDDQGVTIPAADRVAEPLTHMGRKVGASVERDVPVGAAPMSVLVVDGYPSWRLHEPAERPGASHEGQTDATTAVGGTILRICGAATHR